MAMTSERRSTYPLCGAKKKNGQLCRAFAGQGSDHPGIGRCKYHGGSTPSHRKNATKVEAQRQMMLGGPMNVTPTQALMGVLRATAGHVAWLAAEVANLDGLESPEARVVIGIYQDERDRLARVAKACLDSGIAKIEIEFAERQTEAIAKAINVALSGVGGLNNDQKRQFAEALRRELGRLTDTAPKAGGALVPLAPPPVPA